MQFDRFAPFRKPARRRHAALRIRQRASAEIETVEQRCLLSAVVTAPMDMETVTTPTPTITWSAMDGATSYDLWIAQVSPISRSVIETPTGLLGNSYVPADLPDGTIRVWVRSTMGDGSKSAWSPHRDFVVAVPATFTAPSVVGGANPNLGTATPTLKWTAASGNQRFEIFLSDKSRVTSRVIQIYDATRRSFTFSDADPLGVGQYEAFIRAINPDGTADDWGAPIRFRIGTPPEILRPLAPSFQNPAVLEWAAVPGATGYDVFLSKTSTLGAMLRKADNVQGTSYKLESALPEGDYTFWVRARHDGQVVTAADGMTYTGISNVGIWSLPANFGTLRKPVLSGPDLAIIRPGMDPLTTAAFPTIRWTPIDKAARYDLWVDWSAGPAQYVRMNVRATEYTFETQIPEGRFFAWVRAVSERGEFTAWSDPLVFEASGGLPVITGPTGLINIPFPTVEWLEVPDAASYEIWISTSTSIFPIVQETGITGSSYTLSTPLSEGTYRVWLRATLLDGTITKWTKPFAFEISTLVNNDVPAATDAGEIIQVTLKSELQDSPAWLQSGSEATAAETASDSTPEVVVRDEHAGDDQPAIAADSPIAVQHVLALSATAQSDATVAGPQLELEALDNLVSGWHRIDWWSNGDM